MKEQYILMIIDTLRLIQSEKAIKAIYWVAARIWRNEEACRHEQVTG